MARHGDRHKSVMVILALAFTGCAVGPAPSPTQTPTTTISAVAESVAPATATPVATATVGAVVATASSSSATPETPIHTLAPDPTPIPTPEPTETPVPPTATPAHAARWSDAVRISQKVPWGMTAIVDTTGNLQLFGSTDNRGEGIVDLTNAGGTWSEDQLTQPPEEGTDGFVWAAVDTDGSIWFSYTRWSFYNPCGFRMSSAAQSI